MPTVAGSQIVSDRRAISITLQANLNRIRGLRDMVRRNMVAQCRAQVRARLAEAEAALHAAEAISKAVETPDHLEAQGRINFSPGPRLGTVLAPERLSGRLKRSSLSIVSRQRVGFSTPQRTEPARS